MSDITIPLRDLDEERVLFGHLDRNLRILRMSYEIEATSRGGRLTLTGDPEKIDTAVQVVNRALRLIRDSGVDSAEVADIFRESGKARSDRPRESTVGGLRCDAKPRSPNQKKYLDAILANSVTFGLGPAGTGKTYLAVAMAVALVKSGEYRKIAMVRPAVEAGEHLGFLPGDLEAKITPYLRPLYDALEDLLSRDHLKRYLDEGVVEITPLAYMRGRTLNHSVIILDEAQNTTISQMKMFLTRMGESSKIIVTGDASQIDLPGGRESGLVQAVKVLKGVESLAICHLGQADIMRHPVVRDIVKAYARWEDRDRHRAEDDGVEPPTPPVDRAPRRGGRG